MAERIFGQVDAFSCACPQCGSVIVVRASGRRRWNQGRRLNPDRWLTYNPVTSRLRCPQCRAVWAVGLILYPVREHNTSRQPRDTKPTPAELLQIRAQAPSRFLTRVHGSDDPVNELGDEVIDPEPPVPDSPDAGAEIPVKSYRCRTCNGKGHLPNLEEVPCGECQGSGRVATYRV